MNAFNLMAATDKKAFREMRRRMQAESRQYSEKMELQQENPRHNIIEVWRNRHFLATVFIDKGHERVSVNRTDLQNDGDWKAGISWDELMEIKRQIGRGDKWAVEILPPDSEVVNVANMRHFWIIEQPDFAWVKGGKDV